MIIESKKIDKPYAKEFLNVVYQGTVLVKDPRKNIRDLFIIYPGIAVCCLFVGFIMLFMALCTSFFKEHDYLYYCLAGAFLGTLIVGAFYVKILLSLNKSLKKERNVTYTFGEEGFLYEDHESDKLEIKWEDCSSLLILEHGMYFIPDSDKTGALIGLPIEHKDAIKKFLHDNEVELEIVER